MKTASLGLLEEPVVGVNAGGMPPRTPPLLVMQGEMTPAFLVTPSFLPMHGGCSHGPPTFLWGTVSRCNIILYTYRTLSYQLPLSHAMRL